MLAIYTFAFPVTYSGGMLILARSRHRFADYFFIIHHLCFLRKCIMGEMLKIEGRRTPYIPPLGHGMNPTANECKAC